MLTVVIYGLRVWLDLTEQKCLPNDNLLAADLSPFRHTHSDVPTEAHARTLCVNTHTCTHTRHYSLILSSYLCYLVRGSCCCTMWQMKDHSSISVRGRLQLRRWVGCGEAAMLHSKAGGSALDFWSPSFIFFLTLQCILRHLLHRTPHTYPFQSSHPPSPLHATALCLSWCVCASFLLQYAPADVEVMLLGNKCDLENKRKVSTERGQMLAAGLGIKFFETSALSGLNVEEAFLTLARDILDKEKVRDGRGGECTSVMWRWGMGGEGSVPVWDGGVERDTVALLLLDSWYSIQNGHSHKNADQSSSFFYMIIALTTLILFSKRILKSHNQYLLPWTSSHSPFFHDTYDINQKTVFALLESSKEDIVADQSNQCLQNKCILCLVSHASPYPPHYSRNTESRGWCARLSFALVMLKVILDQQCL